VVSVTPRPRLTGKNPVPIVQEAGWASEPIWIQKLEEISFAADEDRNPVVQSVVRHYTDCPNSYSLTRQSSLVIAFCIGLLPNVEVIDGVIL
jgi:hypothetical protein